MLAATISALAPGSAWAEQPTVTSQARAANAEFLAFAPPPPEGAGAVCLVDTGVDLNPDTESNVVERLALDGGDPGDVHHTKHGTSMAMVMGGPVNDWGSVGIWPHVRIVSIRAMPPGESSFPFNYYKRAVDLCGNRLGAGLPIKAVNLSLGGAAASEREVAELRDYVLNARRNGVSVVAAAGNDGGDVQHPAAISDALAVGAADAERALCSFSSRGPVLDLSAPGCGMDVASTDGSPAYGNGTSHSSAVVATVLAALRSYRRDLTVDQAEELVLSTGRPFQGTVTLDVEAAFRAAGLDHIVAAGTVATPAAPAEGPERRSETGAGGPRLPRPEVKIARLVGRRLILRLSNRPRHALVRIRLVYNAGHGEFSLKQRGLDRDTSAFTLRMPKHWSRVWIEYRSLEAQPSRERLITPSTLRRQPTSNRRPRHGNRGA